MNFLKPEVEAGLSDISFRCGDAVVGRPFADQSGDAALSAQAASKSCSSAASRGAPGCRRPKSIEESKVG
jgi:hypothetical protein